jgi:hypothetical protein
MSKIIEEQIKTATALKSLLETEFPDLDVYTSRWGQVLYTSKYVNEIAENCHIRHSCGCCDDAVLDVFPFVKRNDLLIYAKGVPFSVGELSNYRDIPWENWKTMLEENHISETIISLVETYFNNQSTDDDEIEDDDEFEYDDEDEELGYN